MSRTSILIDLERKHGRLRLDQGPFHPWHGDPAWDKDVFGEKGPVIDPSKVPPMTIHGGVLLRHLRAAAEIVLGKDASVFEDLEFGWTSIPIMNACAVRSQGATAIALNIRLNNVLQSANSLTFQMIEKLKVEDFDGVRDMGSRLNKLLRASNECDYDITLSETRPHQSFSDYLWSIRLSQIQLFFVLLHECAHIVLGHLENPSNWGHHPLTDDEFHFFSSSQDAELDADAFAAKALFDHNMWPDILKVTEGGIFDLMNHNKLSSWLVPLLIIMMFVWLHVIAPSDETGYYRIPRTHPHPFDRADHVLDLLKSRTGFFDSKTVEAWANTYFKIFGRRKAT